jgi:plastocyanin
MYIRSGMRRRSALVACATLAVGLAACGGGDDGDGAEAAAGAAAEKGAAAAAAAAPAGSGLEVVAKDIAFEPAELTVGSAPAKITLRNDGAIIHTLVVEGAPGFKLEANKGASDTGTLDVAPGTYTAYCDQPGHRAAGMEAKLTVG